MISKLAFKLWLESHDRLRGEYIYSDGFLESADTDIDGIGHEGKVQSQIAYRYGEDFANEIKDLYTELKQNEENLESNSIYLKIKDDISDLDDLKDLYENLTEFNEEYGPEPEKVLEAFNILYQVNPQQYSNPEMIDAMKALRNGDLRLFSVKYHGSIIIRNNSFELWGWDAEKSKEVVSAIYDITGEELSNPNSDLWNEEIEVFDYKTNKTYTFTIRELTENPFKVNSAPAATLNSKDLKTQSVNPLATGGTRNWQKYYTSEHTNR